MCLDFQSRVNSSPFAGARTVREPSLCVHANAGPKMPLVQAHPLPITHEPDPQEASAVTAKRLEYQVVDLRALGVEYSCKLTGLLREHWYEPPRDVETSIVCLSTA